MPVIVVEKGPEKGKKAAVKAGKPVVVGRADDTDLQITDELSAPKHVRFFLGEDGSCWVENLDPSNNGNETDTTLLNGDPFEGKSKLAVGDKVSIGETLISVMGKSENRKKDKLVGLTIGGYKILERVGRGGMGTVYKANQLNLDRIVALKILSREWNDPNFVEKFKAEARAAGALNHPNIIQVYDVGDEKVKNGTLNYFSMEFASAGSVQDLLDERGKLPIEEALPILRDAAAGLEYAEKKGIVHRDIKPDNLMITDAKVVKIGDLGLAQRTSDEQAGKDSKIFGTPHYVAPEQVKGEKVDHRADMYALGASFYRVMSGSTPFKGSNVKEIIVKQVREEPQDIRQLESSIPEHVAKILRKMMRKNPDERYPTVTDLLADIKLSMDQLEFGDAGFGISGRSKRTFHRRKKAPVAAAVAITIVGLLGIIMLNVIFGGDPVEPTTNGAEAKLAETTREEYGDDKDRYERELAALKRLNALQYSYKGKPPSRRQVNELRALAKEFPETDTGKKASISADAVEKALLKAARTEAMAELNDIRKLWKGAARVTASRLEDVKKKYDKFIKKWKDTDPAKMAESDLVEVETALKKATTQVSSYTSERKQLKPQLIQLGLKKQYGKILELLKALLKKYDDPEITYQIKRDITGYERMAESSFTSARNTAEGHRKAKEFDKALAALRPILDYGIDKLVTQAKALISAVEKQRDAYNLAQQAKQLDADCQLYESMWDALEDQKVLGAVAEEDTSDPRKSVFTATRNFNLDEALRLARAPKWKFGGQSYTDLHAGLVADLEAVQSLLRMFARGTGRADRRDNWGTRVSYTLPRSVAGKFPAYRPSGHIASIKHERAKGWCFEFDAKLKRIGSSTAVIPFTLLPFDKVTELILSKVDKKPFEHRVATVRLLILYGHYKAARDQIVKIGKTADAAEKADLKVCSDRIAGIEKQVKAEYERIKRMFWEKTKPREAISAAKRIRKRYFDTQEYAKIK